MYSSFKRRNRQFVNLLIFYPFYLIHRFVCFIWMLLTYVFNKTITQIFLFLVHIRNLFKWLIKVKPKWGLSMVKHRIYSCVLKLWFLSRIFWPIFWIYSDRMLKNHKILNLPCFKTSTTETPDGWINHYKPVSEFQNVSDILFLLQKCTKSWWKINKYSVSKKPVLYILIYNHFIDLFNQFNYVVKVK